MNVFSLSLSLENFHLFFDIILVSWLVSKFIVNQQQNGRQNDSCIKINQTPYFMRYLKFFIASLFYVRMKWKFINESLAKNVTHSERISCQHIPFTFDFFFVALYSLFFFFFFSVFFLHSFHVTITYYTSLILSYRVYHAPNVHHTISGTTLFDLLALQP